MPEKSISKEFYNKLNIIHDSIDTNIFKPSILEKVDLDPDLIHFVDTLAYEDYII